MAMDDFLERMQNLDPFTQFELFHKCSAGETKEPISIPNPYNDYEDTPIPISLLAQFKAMYQTMIEEESKLVEKDE